MLLRRHFGAPFVAVTHAATSKVATVGALTLTAPPSCEDYEAIVWTEDVFVVRGRREEHVPGPPCHDSHAQVSPAAHELK